TPTPVRAAFERRTVVVPADEQLRPESMLRGVVEDMLQDKPWLPWVVVAFVLGVLLGRAGRD
ncbi:MAG TPA: carbon monoxide dehydrogenase, partial [Roseiflexaceae bacterium]|nr:carbon monoxide dehydrogenase [Roseiflexaceae bacterium]